MTIAMLATGITNDEFWDLLADQTEDRTRSDYPRPVPEAVRWAVIGRYAGLRDAAIDAAANAWDLLTADDDEGPF